MAAITEFIETVGIVPVVVVLGLFVLTFIGMKGSKDKSGSSKPRSTGTSTTTSQTTTQTTDTTQ